jgi:hypothetical protein
MEGCQWLQMKNGFQGASVRRGLMSPAQIAKDLGTSRRCLITTRLHALGAGESLLS